MRLVVIMMVAACGSSREEAAPPKPVTSDPPAPTPTPIDATAATAIDAAVPVGAVDVPIKAEELQAWLVAGHYKSWPHESKQHPSDGPHNDVRVFLSPALASSLKTKTRSHPKGAASVKELYKGGKHSGWAVSVKVENDSANGKGWYWYEVFSTEKNAKAPYQGIGTKLCRECHTEGGTDQVLISYPLQ